MPKKVDHEQRRRQIAEALLRIAGDRGLQAATMREVAAEAGVSLRLVQYYFDTKQELLLGAVPFLGERMSARMIARIGEEAGGASPPPPRAVLEGALTAVMPLDDEGRRLWRTYNAYFVLMLDDPEFAERVGAPHHSATDRFLADHITRAQEAGEIDPELDALTTAAGLFTMAQGLGSGVMAGHRDGPEARAILAYHLDRLFRR
ncbi:TetR/AcrR family transcriptional regulator [Actinomadura rupiterrae]|uniref:TetR/AcrR family transcriptional regulator n=1 Tax=Actinomadura rupiterrae TaxID=559627 RepID=UPI0020A4DFFC|nr:TetR/AcrR family transcriptional regulator [Actinomadura rupiterrae]MCP2340005.1 AcrR family transcriptional regulator [Actinomadura rupiterrae]